jgi:hypothetical protein
MASWLKALLYKTRRRSDDCQHWTPKKWRDWGRKVKEGASIFYSKKPRYSPDERRFWARAIREMYRYYSICAWFSVVDPKLLKKKTFYRLRRGLKTISLRCLYFIWGGRRDSNPSYCGLAIAALPRYQWVMPALRNYLIGDDIHFPVSVPAMRFTVPGWAYVSDEQDILRCPNHW